MRLNCVNIMDVNLVILWRRILLEDDDDEWVVEIIKDCELRGSNGEVRSL